jgi:hypothetical protein
MDLHEPFTEQELAHAMFSHGLSQTGLATKVEIAGAQATAYVWGRQDAGESAHDTRYSLDFGKYYAEKTRGFYGGTDGPGLSNIEGEYLRWRAAQEVAA